MSAVASVIMSLFYSEQGVADAARVELPPQSNVSSIAIIGLGSMGHGMALALKEAGFEVTDFDARPEPLQRFAELGGKSANSPAGAAEKADAVVCVVLNAAQTEEVLFGEDGVPTECRKGLGSFPPPL